MSTRSQNEGLRRIMDLCDELGTLRHRIKAAGPRTDLQTRLRLQARRKVEALARHLHEYRFGGLLGELAEGKRLNAQHFLLLATLLQAYLRGGSPYMEGRAILKRVFVSTYHALQGAVLLAPDSTLRTSGAIVPEEESGEGEDVLQMRFRLAEPLVEAFCAEVTGKSRGASRTAARNPYPNNRELVTDLRLLHNLYQARSDRVFGRAQWNRTTGAPARARQFDRRIRALSERIARRLELSPQAGSFAAVRFQREHGLDEEAMVIVIHLLCQELYDGNAFVDVVELLRLVACDELDLLRKRTLLTESMPLVRKEIVVLEDMYEGRVLTAEAHLSAWVVESVLGNDAPASPIGPDEKLEFHLFLRDLDSARTLFEDPE